MLHGLDTAPRRSAASPSTGPSPSPDKTPAAAEGVAAVSDRRLRDLGYGKRLLAALEPMPFEPEQARPSEFLCSPAAGA